MRPFLLAVYGTGDGDPRDRQLQGFGDVQPEGDIDAVGHRYASAISIGSSAAGGRRDYSCPARLRGVRAPAPANDPYAIGAEITNNAPGSAAARAAANECYHRVSNSGMGTSGNSFPRGEY